jgi:hypothetical protein
MALMRCFAADYYACPHNILAHEPTKWVWVLSAYLILQAAILLVQDMWDPRFFVPERVSTFFYSSTWTWLCKG